MAVRLNKNSIPDEIYFLTFTINDWQNIFVNDEYCSFVYKWFDYVRQKYDNKIHSYAIMPNHIHVLMTISPKSPNLTILIMNAKRFMAKSIVNKLQEEKRIKLLEKFTLKARKREGANYKIFTDRFDSLVIQSEKFWLQKLNYIHNNPSQEKWSLVVNPEDYKYSSAANYILNNGFYKYLDLITA